MRSATPWAKEKLFQIIDYRYLEELPTVITTSETMEELDYRFVTRLLDKRLCEIFAIEARPYFQRLGRKSAQLMSSDRLQITPYQREDRSALLDLMRRSRWTHCHLDFVDASDWLAGEENLVLLARQGTVLLGCLGMSPALAGWRWIRLLGIRDGRMPGTLVERAMGARRM